LVLEEQVVRLVAMDYKVFHLFLALYRLQVAVVLELLLEMVVQALERLTLVRQEQEFLDKEMQVD
jgi:hypothetical protein